MVASTVFDGPLVAKRVLTRRNSLLFSRPNKIKKTLGYIASAGEHNKGAIFSDA